MLTEALGGLLGGWIGGVLPDALEPALNPNHRKIAHSPAAGGALTLAKVSEWQARCRSTADAAASRALACAEGSAERSRAHWEALLLRMFAGMLVGLVAGYASHLALDAWTPQGLPVLGL